MNLKQVQNFVLYKYRYAVAYTVLITVSLLSIFFRLGSYLPGLSASEAQLALSNSSISEVFKSGIYLPYNLLQWLSIELLGPTALAVRLPSALVALVSLAMLFILLHMWHKDKIAISVVVFMATSSWLLNFARYGGQEIYLLFATTALIFFGTVLRHKRHNVPLILSASATLALMLYAPFMIYLLVLFAALYYKEIVHILKNLKNNQIILAVVLWILILAPLIYGFVNDIDTLKAWAGWDGSVVSIGSYFQNLLDTAGHVFWSSLNLPEQHLGDLAMLDMFTTTMIALGLYHYEQHFNLLRTKFLIYGLGVAFLALGLSSSSASNILIAPIIYILAATGIVTLLRQWNKIFPINPFARTLGLLPMALAIAMTSQYHLNRYFNAWALSPVVKIVYAEAPTLLVSDATNAAKSKVVVFVPETIHGQASFPLSDYQGELTIETDRSKLAEYLGMKDVVIYVHGSFQKPKISDDVVYRVIATNSSSLPIAFNVYEL